MGVHGEQKDHPLLFGAWSSGEDRHLSDNHIKMYNSRLKRALKKRYEAF